MSLDRNALLNALVTRLREYSSSSVKKWYTELLTPEELGRLPDPVGIVWIESQAPRIQRGLPTIWDVEIRVLVSVLKQREDENPNLALNSILQGVEDALLLQEDERQDELADDDRYTTLDGLAVQCWISGEVQHGIGETTQQGRLEIPITLRAYQR